jgi:hypothetical protein
MVAPAEETGVVVVLVEGPTVVRSVTRSVSGRVSGEVEVDAPVVEVEDVPPLDVGVRFALVLDWPHPARKTRQLSNPASRHRERRRDRGLSNGDSLRHTRQAARLRPSRGAFLWTRPLELPLRRAA